MSIKKIAEMTGLSTATVSYALNGSGTVSAKSRERVLKAAQEIGYKPNAAAQMLRTQRSNTIAFVIPTDESNPNANFFYMDVLMGIRKKLSETDYDVIVSNYDHASKANSERSLRAVQVCRKQWVDGILFVPSSENPAQLTVLREMNVPFVLLDRRVTGSDYSCVDSDNEQGAFDAVSLFIKNGRKRIGFLGGASSVSTGAMRYRGYVRALEENGLAYESEYVIREKSFSIDIGRERAKELLSKKVDAIFVADNTLAMGAVMQFRDAGVDIPSTIAIIGYDDYAWMDLIAPPLTTVKQQSYQMGYAAAEMLIRKLNGMDADERITLRTRVVVRNSH
ncbi:MAG TPA: LacI family DNA-binding transcriptional regulator [Feifaniaceae bacterium]|nr:LacI family DNA-binding transcriptional regulator [Feifaniaceae bacterium]